MRISEVWDAGRIVCPSELPRGDVRLWQRQLQASAAEVSACTQLLSTEERERALRFRVEHARNTFVLTRATLRCLLAQYLGSTPQEVCFRYECNGKPVFAGNCGLVFNVSHTEGLALLAFAKERAIGVDVEKVRSEIEVEMLAERFFSIRERKALQALAGDELRAAFFRCWTRKEAYIKAKGDGLSLPLHEFDVSIEASDCDALLATRPDPAEAGRWTLCDVSIGPGYAAAVAVTSDEGNH